MTCLPLSSLRGTSCRSNLEVSHYAHISSANPRQNKLSSPLGERIEVRGQIQWSILDPAISHGVPSPFRHCEALRAEAISAFMCMLVSVCATRWNLDLPSPRWKPSPSIIARPCAFRHCEAPRAEAISRFISMPIFVSTSLGNSNLSLPCGGGRLSLLSCGT